MVKTSRPVHANRGIEAAYRKAIARMIAEMVGSVEYWLTAAYRKHEPRVAELAQDARAGEGSRALQGYASHYGPAARMRPILDGLAKRWIDRFDEWAPKISEAYLQGLFKSSDAAFRQSLKDAGWTVEFKMTPAVRDAFNASLQENIGLIKSIPTQYLQQVEGVVMRSYSAGRDLQTMVKELKQLYPANSKRAELIARDQSNKANAVVNRTRQMELGIEEAEWMHSHAGKSPRQSHVEAGRDKRRYKIAQGCPIDGKFIQPGEEINCRCTSRPILPF